MTEYPNLSRQALLTAKRIAHEVWQKYDDQFGYRTEKQLRNDAEPVEESYSMYFFWQQFDAYNQAEFEAKVFELPDDDTKTELIQWINTWRGETFETINNLEDTRKGGE